MSICHHLMLNAMISLFNSINSFCWHSQATYFDTIFILRISHFDIYRKYEAEKVLQRRSFFPFLIPSLASYRLRQTYFLEYSQKSTTKRRASHKITAHLFLCAKGNLLCLSAPCREEGRNADCEVHLEWSGSRENIVRWYHRIRLVLVVVTKLIFVCCRMLILTIFVL